VESTVFLNNKNNMEKTLFIKDFYNHPFSEYVRVTCPKCKLFAMLKPNGIKEGAIKCIGQSCGFMETDVEITKRFKEWKKTNTLKTFIELQREKEK